MLLFPVCVISERLMESGEAENKHSHLCSAIHPFLPFPPPETISEPPERPTHNPLASTPSSAAATITTPAPFLPDLVEGLPPPRTAEPETTEQPPTTTPSTITHNHAKVLRPIHMQPTPQSTAATPTAPHSSPAPSTSTPAASFEGSGSGEPSGDDRDEDEEEEMGEEVGSGIPAEASGAEEPVGKATSFTSLPIML